MDFLSIEVYGGLHTRKDVHVFRVELYDFLILPLPCSIDLTLSLVHFLFLGTSSDVPPSGIFKILSTFALVAAFAFLNNFISYDLVSCA